MGTRAGSQGVCNRRGDSGLDETPCGISGSGQASGLLTHEFRIKKELSFPCVSLRGHQPVSQAALPRSYREKEILGIKMKVVCVCVRAHVWAHVYPCAHVCAYVHSVCMHVWVCACMSACVCMPVHMCADVHCEYMHVWVCAHVRACMHACVHACVRADVFFRF